MAEKRKNISFKKRLEILKRDNYTCKICGRSPVLCHGLSLEVDHITPHSKNGGIENENLQTLCFDCNRGKGNDELLNKTVANEIYALIDSINPEIIKRLEHENMARIVARSDEYNRLNDLNKRINLLQIEIIPNSINGYHAMFNAGIYTKNDDGGTKINFCIVINRK